MNSNEISLSTIRLALALREAFNAGLPVAELISEFRYALAGDDVKVPSSDEKVVRLARRVVEENSYLLEIL